MSSTLQRLSTSLLAAIGLSACGPAIVEDGAPDSGGSGDSGDTDVDVADTDAEEESSSTGELVDECVPDELFSEEVVCVSLPLGEEACPSCDDGSCESAVEREVSQVCGPEYEADVKCGPLIDDGSCCYVAELQQVGAGGCDGRPFVAQGAPRVAPIARSRQWTTALRLQAATSPELAEKWKQRALDEHASIAAFARFVMELLEVGAPASLVADAVEAMRDEVQHAKLAFGVASHHAGMPVGPGPLPTHDVPPSRRLETIACATLVEGAIGETLAAATAALEAADEPDPVLRDVLETIAADETRHAALAWRFLAWTMQRDPTLRGRLTGVFEQSLPIDRPDVVAHLLRPCWERVFGPTAAESRA